MGIFRLEPINGTQDSYHWEASTLAPVTVWVNATSEADAREKLTLTTAIATRKNPNRVMPMAPWECPKLVKCTLDDSQNVQEGFILTADDKSLVIPTVTKRR